LGLGGELRRVAHESHVSTHGAETCMYEDKQVTIHCVARACCTRGRTPPNRMCSLTVCVCVFIALHGLVARAVDRLCFRAVSYEEEDTCVT
jgi:hypothetical protein